MGTGMGRLNYGEGGGGVDGGTGKSCRLLSMVLISPTQGPGDPWPAGQLLVLSFPLGLFSVLIKSVQCLQLWDRLNCEFSFMMFTTGFLFRGCCHYSQ